MKVSSSLLCTAVEEQQPAHSLVTVQVCVLTYKRPNLLRSTLESLINQQTHYEHSSFKGDLQIQILVIDNDGLRTGCDVTEELAERSDFPLKYVSEPARGLSKARNRALEESQTVDFVAFIDDDEMAHPEWLVSLVGAAFRFRADIVTGPVDPRYDNSPTWIKEGCFFNSQHHITGSGVPFVATNNVLLQNSIVRRFRFDNQFDATGGEDTEFFMRLSRAGIHAVWAQEAVVTEHITADRASLRWLLNRARSDANRYTRSCLSFDRSFLTRVRRLLVAGGGFLTGLACLPGTIFGRHHGARGLQLIYRSIGTITALKGQAQLYYETPHD